MAKGNKAVIIMIVALLGVGLSSCSASLVAAYIYKDDLLARLGRGSQDPEKGTGEQGGTSAQGGANGKETCKTAIRQWLDGLGDKETGQTYYFRDVPEIMAACKGCGYQNMDIGEFNVNRTDKGWHDFTRYKATDGSKEWDDKKQKDWGEPDRQWATDWFTSDFDATCGGQAGDAQAAAAAGGRVMAAAALRSSTTLRKPAAAPKAGAKPAKPKPPQAQPKTQKAAAPPRKQQQQR